VKTVSAVILAAGAGRRLGALGRRHSKPMLPLAGRPLVAWVIDSLRQAGIVRLVVVGHPSDAALAAFLQAGYPDITLALQPERRGIADALQHALPLIADQPAYLCCACDSVFESADIARVLAVGRRCVGEAVIAVLDMGRAATSARSAVVLDGDRVTRIVEKPPPGTAPSGLVALPLYWLPAAVGPLLTDVPAVGGERHVSTALNVFLHAGGSARAVIVRHRLEITTATDAEQAAICLEHTQYRRTEITVGKG
jgi:dTDP-glucose pyrophosphorylase